MARARWPWSRRKPLTGTLGARYLAGRGITDIARCVGRSDHEGVIADRAFRRMTVLHLATAPHPMTEPIRFVTTTSIREAVNGRETDILDAIGVRWRDGRPHIKCPYPGHADNNASWRWDTRRSRAFCTCIRADSIFDVVMKVLGCDFETAKIRVAELLNRHDLIRTKGTGAGNGQRYQATDAASLLSAPAESAMMPCPWPTSPTALAWPGMPCPFRPHG